jgi:hypothetical protein
MSLINSSATIFIAIVILVVLPSIWTTPAMIGFSITFGSLLVVLQTVLVLKDSGSGGDQP